VSPPKPEDTTPEAWPEEAPTLPTSIPAVRPILVFDEEGTTQPGLGSPPTPLTTSSLPPKASLERPWRAVALIALVLAVALLGWLATR